MIKLFRYLKPYYGAVTLGMLALLGQAFAELYLPNLMSDMVNNGMLKGDTGYIYGRGGVMIAVAFVSMACAVAAGFFSSRLALGFGRDVRNAIFTKAGNYSLAEFDKFGTASLITRTTNDVVQVQMLIVMGFRFIIYSPLMCFGGIVMALSKDRHLAVILLVSVPVLLMVLTGVARKVVPSFTIMQQKIDKLNLTMRESLTGIRVIRAFNRMDYEKDRFRAANKDLTDLSIRLNKIMAMMMPVMMLIFNATSVAIIWFGGLRVSANGMQIGDMMAFLQYAMMIMMSVTMVAMMFVMIPRAQASAKRINEVLNLESKINDPAAPVKAKSNNASVEFKDVTFSYPGAELAVLEGITFAANAGETTAIIGGTGSGKSTLVNLIPRFYDVTGGSILIDGVDIRDMAQDDLRAKIGFVPQGPMLFSGTVRENICFGSKDATQEETEHAATVAQAYDFITKMPEGFDSVIAQGGANVSGGQKQRISIARALIRHPEIYIFDDSFSALDFTTDARLRAALNPETANSAVIIVAQRVGSIMDADRIIVIDNGKIAGIGTHRELLAGCEIYREICASQLSEEELA